MQEEVAPRRRLEDAWLLPPASSPPASVQPPASSPRQPASQWGRTFPAFSIARERDPTADPPAEQSAPQDRRVAHVSSEGCECCADAEFHSVQFQEKFLMGLSERAKYLQFEGIVVIAGYGLRHTLRSRWTRRRLTCLRKRGREMARSLARTALVRHSERGAVALAKNSLIRVLYQTIEEFNTRCL